MIQMFYNYTRYNVKMSIQEEKLHNQPFPADYGVIDSVSIKSVW